VVRAIHGQGVILMDGGIRRGSDVLKAICMGASAVLIGRAYAYGLMAEGREGVLRSIEILKADLLRTMALLGCSSLGELNESFVDFPRHW
jgi:L-lactate dehydrogenase (cytochrome)